MIVLLALILTNKRAHLLFGFGAIMLGYYLCEPKKKISNFFKIIIIGLIVIAIFIIAAQYVPFINDLYQRFLTSGEDDESTSRFKFWKLCIENFIHHPLFGIGWGGFLFEYHEHLFTYNNNENIDRSYMYAHNVYFQLLCETGLFGFTLFLSNGLYILKKTINKFKENLFKYDKNYVVVLFSLILQIFFYLYWITGNGLYDRMFSFFTVAVGFIIGIYSQNNQTVQSHIFNRNR